MSESKAPTCNLCGSEKVSLTLTCHEPACMARQQPSPHGSDGPAEPLPYQLRVLDEQRNLQLRLSRLQAMLARSDVATAIPDPLERKLLSCQAAIMTAYGEVLQLRIDRF